MPWVVGIDEAGYGPNLGPLVQAAVALNFPTATRRAGRRSGRSSDDAARRRTAACSSTTRRRSTPATGSRLSNAASWYSPRNLTVAELVRKVGLATCREDLGVEAWYDPAECLPVVMSRDEWQDESSRFCERGRVRRHGV